MDLTTKRIGALTSSCVFMFALSGIGQAQPKQPSAAAKDSARTLLLDCRDKFGKKDFEGALKSCKGAHSIMGVPTTGLDLAKVQQAMGLLVEARETALEVVRFDNSANNPAFAQAQTDANKIAQDLEKRIPSLTLNVSGLPSDTTVRVVVDADEVPAAAMSLPYRVNPGDHTVVASAQDFKDNKQTISVSEGQTLTVDLAMSRGGADEAPPAPGRKIPVWAWIAGGVGVVGTVGAFYFGTEFGETKTKVDTDCPNNQCNSEYTPQEASDLQSKWNQTLALTVVSSTIGAAGLGAAIYGIVTAPKKTEATARVMPRITPWIGRDVSGVVLSGSF